MYLPKVHEKKLQIVYKEKKIGLTWAIYVYLVFLSFQLHKFSSAHNQLLPSSAFFIKEKNLVIAI